MSPYNSNIIAIKRRLAGAPGAPLLSAAEIAFNQVDSTLYYGFSSLDTNTVTSIAIAGSGAFVSTTENQTINGVKSFAGVVNFDNDVTFNNPVSFRNSDFNFGNFASYVSLSSLGTAVLSATNFVGVDTIVNASTVTTLVSTADVLDKSNKAASTSFVHGLVDSIAAGLSNGIVDVSTNQTIAGNKTFTGSTTLSSTSLGGSKITNLGDPKDALDAVNKKYVDSIASSINIHAAVRAATVTELSPVTYNVLSNGLYDTLIWDSGIDPDLINNKLPNAFENLDFYIGDRILIKDQFDKTQNGVYILSALNVNQKVTFQRAEDYNQSIPGEVAAGDYLFVSEGTYNANKGFVLTTDNPIILGTTPLEFTQFTGAGQITVSNGLQKIGDTLSLTDVGTPGTYLSVTTDAQGRVVAANNPNTLVGLSSVAMSTRQLPLFTGTNTVCAVSLSNYGETLISTTYNTVSSVIGINTMAYQAADNASITGGTLNGVTITQSYFDAGTF